MSTNFPISLDTLTDPNGQTSLAANNHSALHTAANDAIEALQAKVGVNNSTDPTSLDKRVKTLEESGSAGGDMTKAAYDSDNDGKVDAAEVADTVPWSGVTNPPATYAPSAHSHSGTYELVITAGTSAQYLRGDKTLGTFASDVLASVLTGLSTATNAAAVATDTVLAALGKLQAQIAGIANATMTLINKTLSNPTITNYTETYYAPAAGTAFTVDLANGTVQRFTSSGNITITLPASVAGKSYVIEIAYGGAHTVTFSGGSTIKWPAATAPTATSVIGKIDRYVFEGDGTNTLGADGGRNF